MSTILDEESVATLARVLGVGGVIDGLRCARASARRSSVARRRGSSLVKALEEFEIACGLLPCDRWLNGRIWIPGILFDGDPWACSVRGVCS
jgi:hypothetical protein